ncbi:N-alpha-acetyltransferase 60 [Lingula anatina]|uniref:N-alpha-acetyltransferase 60 n=1 Tax=Lingula anatina TaxID=7574 RepID=A0A1S3HY38_LINAN|nr:N-alpha-acetyltransferase 60 [Lingula anatina]|eukprot:XP_013389989.1 N-alpha-acetyltransferase 60 [Lingula anatina]
MTQQNSFSIQREVQMRFLSPSDIDDIKKLCADWFPIDYPENWFKDITSNTKFFSLAATFNGQIIGMIVADIKPRSTCNKEDSDLLASHYPANIQVAYILSLGVVRDFRNHGIDILDTDTTSTVNNLIPMTQQNSFSIQREVQMRFLSPSDINDIKKLCADWFPIDYPENWFKDITSNTKFFSLAATFNGQIIGMIVADIKPRSTCNKEDSDLLASHYPANIQVAYILSLGVVRDFRNHGIASLLLETLLQHLTTSERQNCKAVYLHVLTANATAIRFYERRNFKLHSFLPYYYSIKGSPSDGYTYVLYINGGEPPWTAFDYLRNVGHFCSSLVQVQVCAIPQRLFHHLRSWVKKVVLGSPDSDIRQFTHHS